MKRIFLIQAHKDVEYINDLIEQLNHDNFIIYIHLDKKSNIDLNLIHPKAILIRDRIDVRWGEFSQVEATLNGIKQIVSEQSNFSHIVLLSGQDFPLKNNLQIDDFLDANVKNSFMDYNLITKDGKFSNFEWRYNHYHFPSSQILIRKIYNLLIRLNLIEKFNRKKIEGINYYWGSQWWILNKPAIDYILNASTPRLKKYFKYVFCSDELFFQILLLNSNINLNIINKSLKFMIWDEYDHPKKLSLEDFSVIDFENNLFCRKVEKDISETLKEKIKNRIRL